MRSSWVSLKLATTQIWSGTNIAEVRARLRILPDRAGEVDDAARLVGGDGRIAEVKLGLVALRVGLGELGFGGSALRLQRVDLPLGHFERRFGAVDRGLLGLHTLNVGRALLSRRPSLLDQRFVASPGDLGELEIGLRLRHLRLACRDLRVLRGDLRVDVGDSRFCRGHLGVGLLERGAVIPLVDLGDHGALLDMLVVGDRNGGDVARDLGRDRELARGDEGVVGRLEMAWYDPSRCIRRPPRTEAPRDRAASGSDVGGGTPCAGLWLGFSSLRRPAQPPSRRARRARRARSGAHLRALGSGGSAADAPPLAAPRRGAERREMMSRLGPDDTPGASCRSLVPIGFGRGRVLVHLLASVLIPARHGRNSTTLAPRAP